MGSVLADNRFQNWTYVDVQNNTATPRPTWANIEYEFWDMWRGNKPLPYLPGEFFYKGSGPIVAIGQNNAEQNPILPTEIDQYMLGGYGGIRTKGKDVLGEEEQITYFTRSAANNGDWLADANFTDGGPSFGDTPMQGGVPGGPGGPGAGNTNGLGTLKIWPWTRSTTSADDKNGSPYGPANIGDSNEQLQYGKPNGIRDGIVLVLTAGEDYIGDR
jgi:hypothetical protein